MASPDGPWVRFFPSDWLAGTRGMSAAETGVYITLVAIMYERCEPIVRDDARLARLCGLPTVTFRGILDTLITEEKVTLVNGNLWGRRVGMEVENRKGRSEKARDAANTKHQQNQRPISASAPPEQSVSSAPVVLRAHASESQPQSEEDSSLRSLGEHVKNDDVKLAFDDWNTLAGFKGLPKAATLNAKRKASIRQRLSECGGIEGWRDALRMIPQSPFLMGENNTGFTATLDFVIQASSFTKLREGNYAKRGNGPAPKPSKTSELRNDLRNRIGERSEDTRPVRLLAQRDPIG